MWGKRRVVVWSRCRAHPRARIESRERWISTRSVEAFRAAELWQLRQL